MRLFILIALLLSGSAFADSLCTTLMESPRVCTAERTAFEAFFADHEDGSSSDEANLRFMEVRNCKIAFYNECMTALESKSQEIGTKTHY